MTDQATLSCGHAKAEEAEPDGTTWCLVCAMFVQAEAIDAIVVSSSPAPAWDPPDFDLGAIAQRFEERLRPALEAALGATMPAVVFVLRTSAEMKEIVRAENRMLLEGAGVRAALRPNLSRSSQQ